MCDNMNFNCGNIYIFVNAIHGNKFPNEDLNKDHPGCVGPKHPENDTLLIISRGTTSLQFTKRDGTIYNVQNNPDSVLVVANKKNGLDKNTYFSKEEVTSSVNCNTLRNYLKYSHRLGIIEERFYRQIFSNFFNPPGVNSCKIYTSRK